MKKSIYIALCMILSFTCTAFAATHYVLGKDSVDDGEIRCGGSTTYRTNWDSGRSTWNSLEKVKITGDANNTLQDLTVKDVNKDYVSWAGYYDYDSLNADEILLNTYYLKNYSKAWRTNVCTHELGHALGLAHSISDNIMDENVTSRTSLGKQDKLDYNYLWN